MTPLHIAAKNGFADMGRCGVALWAFRLRAKDTSVYDIEIGMERISNDRHKPTARRRDCTNYGRFRCRLTNGRFRCLKRAGQPSMGATRR